MDGSRWPRGELAACTLVVGLVVSSSAAGKTTETIAVIVNKKNPINNITRVRLREIYLKHRRTWSNGQTIIGINAARNSPLRKSFQLMVMKMTQQQIGAYWVKQSVKGRGRPPRASASGLARRLVAALPGAIAYVRLRDVDATVKVVNIDKRQPTDAGYHLRFKP